MTLSEYNNQILLTIDDVKPINDDKAKERGNSLRLLGESTDINKWFECRDACLNNPDCETYKFDEAKTTCKIYRKEPYKEEKDLSLNDCINFCSKDNDCDFLSHSNDNTCLLYTRENNDYNDNACSSYINNNNNNSNNNNNNNNNNNKSRTAIGEMWFDFPIYGLNLKKGVSAGSFGECRKKLGHDYFVYYDDAKYCVPKRFFEQSFGNKTVYFNKRPVDKYKILNKYIGLKSENRENVEFYKIIVFVIWIILLFIAIYFLIKK
jgi:hypothetical protein